MGCSVRTQFKAVKAVSSQDSHIIVQPGTFVRENDNSFQDIYRLGKLLGTGTFGEVRICMHRVSGLKRAVKIIRKDLLTSAHQRATLDNEIKILKSLDHPNIVRVNEFFEEVKRLYIVMEYCKGGELFGEIVKKGYLTEGQAVIIMKQIFLTLEYLHSQGIIHRDLKPENIMLEEKHDVMNIKIIDFGTAIVNNTRYKMIGNAGTIYYMSPEILVGNYTYLCDVWSAGVIMYIILSGSPPFDGKSNLEIMEKIQIGKFSLDSEQWVGVSEAAKQLLQRILTPEAERITSKQALEDVWITNNSVDLTRSQITRVLSKLKDFRSTSVLREAIRTYITTQYISAYDIKDLKAVFMDMDKDHDGKISYEELMKEYLKIMDEKEARKISALVMNEVDSDKDGFIEYSEFLKANLDTKKVMSVENLNAAFRMFDQDGNGKISAEEIKMMLQGDNIVDTEIWSKIIQEFDVNGDGEIDMEEFGLLIKSFTSNSGRL